jgi:hypothetical protein
VLPCRLVAGDHHAGDRAQNAKHRVLETVIKTEFSGFFILRDIDHTGREFQQAAVIVIAKKLLSVCRTCKSCDQKQGQDFPQNQPH